jgi:hypothetical protein
MMNTKRCGGYRGYWECGEDYPDHMVPVSEFAKCLNGLQTFCRRCQKYGVSFYNAKISSSIKLVGSVEKLRAMTKKQRSEIFALVESTNNAVVDTTPRHKSEFGQSTPMTKRETTVVEGEQVPEGWVYVVYNPDVPSVLKIGKTFPDGIPSIMSSARRFGRAELADKFWFDEAYKAEQAIHTVLSDCNLRSLGYSDCGVELFKCNLNDVKGAIENAIR